MKTMAKSLMITMVMLMCILSITAVEGYTKHSNVEVEPPENTSFTIAQQQNIIDYLVYKKETPAPKGLTCFLFGHSLTLERWSVTYHLEHSTAPKCIRNVYDVSYCSRCDYITSELVSTVRVFCCS